MFLMELYYDFPFLLLLLILVPFIIAWFAAKEFYEIAKMKGHFEKKYFWWCFWIGMIGWPMVIALPDRVSEKQKQVDEENAVAERVAAEKAEQERIAAEKQAKQERQAAEKAKRARVAAYWEKHPEEFKALVEKQAEAKEKLSQLGGLAVEQKKALQDIISAIDDELSKDREG